MSIVNSLKIGSSYKTITPTEIIDIYGLDFIQRNSSVVLDDLYVKTMFFEHGVNRIVLISVDLIWISNEIVESIKHWIYTNYKISAENILICASHSHSTPQIRPNTFNDSKRSVPYEIFLNKQIR